MIGQPLGTYRVLALTVVAGGLAGCAVGSSRFSCPGMPQGVRCANVTDIYELTNTVDRIEATAKDPLGDDAERAEDARAAQRLPVEAGEAAAAGDFPASVRPTPLAGARAGWVQPPRVDRPTPVRTPAQVMRVWMAPWEDTRGVLHVGGYHFVEVVARRWTIGGPVEGESSRVFTINYDDTVVDGVAGADGTSGANGAGQTTGGGNATGTVGGSPFTGN